MKFSKLNESIVDNLVNDINNSMNMELLSRQGDLVTFNVDNDITEVEFNKFRVKYLRDFIWDSRKGRKSTTYELIRKY